MGETSLFFRRGETPMRIEFFPYAEGSASMEGDKVGGPETLLLVEMTFFGSRKTLGFARDDFESALRRDRDGVMPVRLYLDGLLQECVRDLRDRDALPTGRTLAKHSADFDRLMDEAAAKFKEIAFAN